MENKGEKWYIYRHPESHKEIRRGHQSAILEMLGYRLIDVVDTYVDEKKMKVGGK